MIRELDRKKSMSLYGSGEEEHEYVLISMGVAYRLSDDAIWFVKVPIEEKTAQERNAVMVRVEGDNPKNHEEIPDETVVREAVHDVVEWYENRS